MNNELKTTLQNFKKLVNGMNLMAFAAERMNEGLRVYKINSRGLDRTSSDLGWLTASGNLVALTGNRYLVSKQVLILN